MLHRLSSLLVHPHLPLAIALLGVVLTALSLGLGIWADDFMHRATLLGLGTFSDAVPVMDLFRFTDGTLEGNQALFELGGLPWWAAPDLLAAFFRPLAALSHIADYALWPDAFWLQHLHGLDWWGLGIIVVARFLRSAGQGGAALGLAALLFAIDDAHAMAIAWIANCSALFTVVFGYLAVSAHIRWRRGQARALAAALLWTALTLLSAEAGLGALADLVAWQLTRDEGSWGRRLLALAPATAVVVTWRALYGALGYGYAGSDLYIDPVRSPLAFARAALERLPVLVAGQWLPLPIDAWMLVPRAGHVAMSVIGLATLVGLGALLLPLLRRSAEARFWALASLLAMVPVCATFPSERLLLHAGAGMFALLGLLVADAGWLGAPAVLGPARRVAVGLLLARHLGAALPLLPLRTATMLATGNLFGSGAVEAPDDPAVADQTVVFVTGHDLTVAYTGLIREVEGVRMQPPRVAVLGPWSADVTVTRADAHTLELAPEGGYFANAIDGLFWSPEPPMEQGHTVRMPDFIAEVVALTDDGRPARVRFRFDEPLEVGPYRFVAEIDGRVAEWAPPPPGETTVIAASIPRMVPERLHFVD